MMFLLLYMLLLLLGTIGVPVSCPDASGGAWAYFVSSAGRLFTRSTFRRLDSDAKEDSSFSLQQKQ